MVTIEKLEKSQVKLTIEVSADHFDHGLEHAFKEIQNEVEIKGFRKGKVPMKMYEQKYGIESLYDEAINHVISETYYDALMEHDVLVVAQPKVDFDINTIGRGKPFTYTATVAVKPDVILGSYKNLEMKKPEEKVTAKDVDAEIDKLREQNAEMQLVEKRAIQAGDTAIFDFKGTLDGVAFDGGTAENYELKIGSNSFIPGFEDQMIGLKSGEEKALNLTFPKDYQAADLAGKAVVFEVKVHEIKEMVLPPLTDAFVKELDKENIATVEALKKSIKDDLKKQKVSEAKNKKTDFAVQTASENATVDIPEDMIVAEKNRMLDNTKQQAKQYGLEFEQYLQFSGMDLAQFEEKLMEDAKKSIRYNLVLEAVAKKEAIKATDKEFKTRMQELAEQYKMSVEQVASQLSDDVVKQDIEMNKAVDFLVESLVLK